MVCCNHRVHNNIDCSQLNKINSVGYFPSTNSIEVVAQVG